MLDKIAIREKLTAHRQELETMGVKSLYLFGSFVRGEQKKKSDIDLIVDFSEVPDLFKFIGIQRQLSNFLGCHVDLVMPRGLHPALRTGIINEAELAYGAQLDFSAGRYSARH